MSDDSDTEFEHILRNPYRDDPVWEPRHANFVEVQVLLTYLNLTVHFLHFIFLIMNLIMNTKLARFSRNKEKNLFLKINDSKGGPDDSSSSDNDDYNDDGDAVAAVTLPETCVCNNCRFVTLLPNFWYHVPVFYY